ncbi:hypothetical protein [Streptomyces sp. Tue6028]|uniref:hypothetical protein n=1 Tax=Streptomyces sp. Tue6028 TaxID=2036037 RepID=UPI003EB7CC4F
MGGTPAGPLLAGVLEVVQLVDHHDREQQRTNCRRGMLIPSRRPTSAGFTSLWREKLESATTTTFRRLYRPAISGATRQRAAA